MAIIYSQLEMLSKAKVSPLDSSNEEDQIHLSTTCILGASFPLIAD